MKTTRPAARVLSVALVALLAAACGDAAESAPQAASDQAPGQAQGQLPEGHPPLESSPSSPYSHPSPAPVSSPAPGPAAVVLEVQDVTDYSYARVESGGEEIWVAGPRGGVAEGDTVSLGNAMGMTDFRSEELDRTFASILFLDRWRSPAPVAAENTGTVLEAVGASSYTYIRVEADGEELWLAGPRVRLEEGQTIAWGQGMPMRDFESRTLDRTFEEILFVNDVQVVR